MSITRVPASTSGALLALLLAIGSAPPALAADQNGRGPAAPASQPAQGQQAQPGSILILPAADLINRRLKDAQGHDAGQINSIVLDDQNGAVDFVVIGGAGNFNLNGQVIAVPWSVLQPPTRTKGAITLKVSAEKLAQAPRLNPNSIADLTQPRSRANIYGYYGYAYPPYAAYAPRNGYARPDSGYAETGAVGVGSSTANGARPTANAGQTGGNRVACAPGYNPSAYPGQNGAAGQGHGAVTQGSNNAANQGPNNRGATNGERQANRVGPTKRQMNETQRQMVQDSLVVGTDGVVSALRSKTTTSANAMPSATVVADNGNMVGHVDQVLLDTEHGEVAFVLLERGGFLGLNPTWFAVPIDALSRASCGNNYELTVNEHLLNSEPSVPVNKNHLPTQVDRQELAQLYQHFGIAPYWEQGGQKVGQTAPQAPVSQSGSSEPR